MNARYVLVAATTFWLTVLLWPSVGWAHDCGKRKLTVAKGNTVVYSITGPDYADYKIVDKGDPRVATIEPPMNIDKHDLVFRITGTGTGTTVFKIYWEGPRGAPQRQEYCRVKVTVTAQ